MLLRVPGCAALVARCTTARAVQMKSSGVHAYTERGICGNAPSTWDWPMAQQLTRYGVSKYLRGIKRDVQRSSPERVSQQSLSPQLNRYVLFQSELPPLWLLSLSLMPRRSLSQCSINLRCSWNIL